MRTVFMGTPDFASEALKQLYDTHHEVCAVFTQPDRPKNRGMKVSFSPVKALALERGTPVYQPETLRGGAAAGILREISPDIIIAVAYGKLLPKEVLELPKYGCINIHGSILPKYRGSAPVQWAVINGERETGVTAMFLDEGMDTGDMIAVSKTQIGEDETAGELFDRLAVMGGRLLCETLDMIESGSAQRTPQNDAEATYAPPLTKEMSRIDWTRSAGEIQNLIRGLNPWPVATAEIAGTLFKVFSSKRGDGKGRPGEVLSTGKDGIEIACADGSVVITELQAAGGKRMSAADYLRGHPICL